MGVLEGQVVLVSEAARGLSRSDAIGLAEEDANIIGFDICKQIASVAYPNVEYRRPAIDCERD
jgi:hypothetical protein